MNNDLPFDDFSHPASEDPIASIGTNKSKNIVIETPLFDLIFKSTESKFHTVKPNAFYALMSMDSLAKDLVKALVEIILRIQAAVIGEEATVGDNPTPVYNMFDSSGALLPEFQSRVANSKRVEALFAEANAHVETAQALIAQRDQHFPHATNKLQFAFDFGGVGRIETLKEAIAYQKTRSGSYAAMKAKVAARAKGRADIPARETVDPAAMLGL